MSEALPAGFASSRLAVLASLVTPGAVVADIGTDHAWLLQGLVETGRCPAGIGIDLHGPPLKDARRRLVGHLCAAQIVLRQGDGLGPLVPGEVQEVVIAGVGGVTMCKVLVPEGLARLGIQAVILQPNREIERVRRWLAAAGWAITRERVVEERGRFFPTLRAEPAPQGVQELGEAEALFGAASAQEDRDVWIAYLTEERARLEGLLGLDGAAGDRHRARAAAAEASVAALGALA